MIYATSETTYPTSYTLNGITASTGNEQITSSPIGLATSLTDAVHMQGEDVVALDASNWLAKAVVTGIYKVNNAGTIKYVEIKVTKLGNSYEISESNVFNQFTFASTLTNLQIVTPTENVYVDTTNNIVYGNTTETVIVSAIKEAKKTLYSGTFATNQFDEIKANVLEALEWTTFASHTLNEASTTLHIEGNDVYALAVGEEKITFESPNGLERTLKIIVNADYTITVTAETPHMLKYSISTPAVSLDEITFTFTLNIPESVQVLTIMPSGSSLDATVLDNKLKVIITLGIPATSTFTNVFPELVAQTPLPITVVTNDITDYQIVNDTNAQLRFNLVQL
ncbi:hypothetical protein [Metasolibacillus fluoroglycofenilyticus]|uniref:hypothetical protein n=1 Tax=Metasolibacillus fluoroglycofenilyticus TaxID=1239396 RepID=UPI000D3A1565|nr:hypothetical protein [Metasolibacillus fluoroglycofenilyticus]